MPSCRYIFHWILLLSVPPVVCQERVPTLSEIREIDRNREDIECASEILKMLSLQTGHWVADIGAGAGYYAERLSSIVPNGRVFAVEISPRALGILRQRKSESRLGNVVIVEGAPHDPRLPDASLDAVLVVRTYHAFTQPVPMLERVLRALKPGGRVVVVDWRNKRSQASDPRDEQTAVDEIALSVAEGELRSAGFGSIERREPLCARPPGLQSPTSGEDLWALVGRR